MRSGCSYCTRVEPGVTDLADFDFSRNVAVVATEYTNSVYIYPGAFYYPQDFADTGVPAEGVLYGYNGTFNQGESTLRQAEV